MMLSLGEVGRTLTELSLFLNIYPSAAFSVARVVLAEYPEYYSTRVIFSSTRVFAEYYSEYSSTAKPLAKRGKIDRRIE